MGMQQLTMVKAGQTASIFGRGLFVSHKEGLRWPSVTGPSFERAYRAAMRFWWRQTGHRATCEHCRWRPHDATHKAHVVPRLRAWLGGWTPEQLRTIPGVGVRAQSHLIALLRGDDDDTNPPVVDGWYEHATMVALG